MAEEGSEDEEGDEEGELLAPPQHWDSYTNAAVKRALVQGALYRTLRFSDADASVVLPVVAHWATELRAHGYLLLSYTRLY